MTHDKDTAVEFLERMRRKAPACLDLLTSETLEEFEAAFTELLEGAVTHLEKNKDNFASLGEEGLSAVLAGSLTMPGLTVIQETYSNGHVDLTIEADQCTPARKKLGEAKIYSGPTYHIKGIGQLLGRYTTGRETAGLLISNVRKKNIRGITERLKTEMDRQRPERQIGPCGHHILKWSFVTKHKHSSGEISLLYHIGCTCMVNTPAEANRRVRRTGQVAQSKSN